MTDWTGQATGEPEVITGVTRPAQTTVSYRMELYTETLACISLLQTKYFELLDQADLRIAAGDFQHARGAGIIDAIKEALAELKEELKNIIHGRLPRSLMGVPGFGYDWNNNYNDKSFMGLARPSIDGSGLPSGRSDPRKKYTG